MIAAQNSNHFDDISSKWLPLSFSFSLSLSLHCRLISNCALYYVHCALCIVLVGAIISTMTMTTTIVDDNANDPSHLVNSSTQATVFMRRGGHPVQTMFVQSGFQGDAGYRSSEWFACRRVYTANMSMRDNGYPPSRHSNCCRKDHVVQTMR